MFDGTDGNCWAPDWPVAMDREPRMRVAKFGDGYEQRTIDGLNPMMTTWKLTWSMRPHDVLVEMEDYLTERWGAAFPFLDPHSGTLVNVFCDKWSVNWSYKGNKDHYGDLSAEFRRAYGASIFTPALP